MEAHTHLIIVMHLRCRSTGYWLALEIAFLLIRKQLCDWADVIFPLPVPPSGKNGLMPSKRWLKACRNKRRR